MKTKKLLSAISLAILSLVTLSSCAAGAATAATAGYSLNARSADNLTAQGEARLIERAKREIYAEMYMNGNQPCYQEQTSYPQYSQ